MKLRSGKSTGSERARALLFFLACGMIITNYWNPRDVQNNLDISSSGTFYNSVGRNIRLKFEFVKF